MFALSSDRRIVLPTYTSGSENSLRTFLHVVPSQLHAFASFFSTIESQSALIANDSERQDKRQMQDQSLIARKVKNIRWFAAKLHAYSHLRVTDMVELCRRAKILSPQLRSELENVASKCTTCLQTGRPLNARKVSFSRVLSSFNEHIQIDFMFIAELGNLPILHMVDVGTGFSATVLMTSRDLDEAARFVELHWFNVHGPPRIVSGDPEMFKGSFKELLSRHYCKFDPRPARRHNKIGSVEAANNSLRVFVQRLLLDAEYARNTTGTRFSDYEILSRATFLSNVLYGSKKLSSFELARGYSPSICGTPQAPVSDALLQAHYEQAARRAIHRLLVSPSNRTQKRDVLIPRTPVYFFEKKGKRGSWNLGFVKRASDHIVEICRSSRLSGKALQVAFEDIRLAPKSSLLYELDQLELDKSIPDPSTSIFVGEDVEKSVSFEEDVEKNNSFDRDIGSPSVENTSVGKASSRPHTVQENPARARAGCSASWHG